MGRELVPGSTNIQSQRVWHELEYKGDINAYIDKLDKLMIQHLIHPLLAHSLACMPLGKELVAKSDSMDEEISGDGITFTSLKRQIRCYTETLPRPSSASFP